MRWESREIAAIGIIGALLSPVLVDSGTSGVALAFMAIALVSATGVLLWKKWDWLAVAAFVTSVPQLVAWLDDSYRDSLLLALGVLGCFWVVYVVAAVGFELRVPTEKLRFSSASLLLADAILTAGAGWLMLDGADHGDAATGWVIGVAVVHVALGAATFRGRISREIALLLLAVGIGLSAIGAGWPSTAPRSSRPGRSRPSCSRGWRAGWTAPAATSRRPASSALRRSTRSRSTRGPTTSCTRRP